MAITKSINQPLVASEPVIEYIDEEFKNPSDHTKVTFVVKGDPKEVIKWCRRNFGNRGDGWDFLGGTKHVQLIIWSSKLLVMWQLWQE
jgi:hypothetical protein